MKFRKKEPRSNPEISTASLPDIVFMLLFFFMVATVMRKNDTPQKVNLPEVVDITKIQMEKDLRIFLPGESSNIIIGGVVTSLENVNDLITQASLGLTIEEKEKIEVLIFADESTSMDKLYALKVALRKNDLRKVNYMANYIADAGPIQ